MRNFTDKNEYLYDAFISYRHAEPDKYVAENLHRELESFKLPRNLIKKLDDSKKVRINRVFRDRDELPIASNLADPITQALEASEFLLVICSPRLLESLWCKKEIELFMQMHDRDHVLAVLIEGEPDDSFPDELRYIENKRVNADGTVSVERIATEPLAADVRGKNHREIKKKIKEEVLRLAAPMFDCSYDELKQRHRERRIRRILTAAAIGSGICLFFGAISTSMALRIQGQNIEISEKATEIQKQSEEIQTQSEEIQKQYWAALENYALGEAENALELLEQGDRIQAVKTAREILPESLENQEIPYTYQAEYALSKSMRLYDSGYVIAPDFTMKHNTNISMCKLSPDGKTLLTTDDAGTIYVWDMETGTLLLENGDYANEFMAQEIRPHFMDSDTFFFTGYDKIVRFTISSRTAEEFTMDTGSRMVTDQSGGKLAMIHGKRVQILNGEDMSLIAEHILEEDWQAGSILAFNQEGDRLAFYATKGTDDILYGWEETKVFVMDCRSGEVTEFSMKQQDIGQLAFDGDTLYIANYQNYFSAGMKSIFNEQLEGIIYACDLSQNKVKWTFTDEQNALYDVKPSGNPDSRLVFCASYSGVYLLNNEDGSPIGMLDLAESIINVNAVLHEDTFFVSTREGNMYYVRNNDGIIEAVDIGYRFFGNSQNVMYMEQLQGNIVIAPYNSTEVTVCRTATGTKTKAAMEIEGTLADMTVSPDNKTYVLRNYDDESAHIYDAATEVRTGSMPAQGYVVETAFVGKENRRIATITGSNLYLNENITGADVAHYELEFGDLFFLGEYNERVASVGYRDVVIYDALTGQEISRTGIGDLMDGIRYYAVSGISGHLAASYPEEDKLKIFTVGDMQEIQTISLNAAYIKTLFFDRSTDVLYISYKDNSVEAYAYQDNDWTLAQSYPPFEYEVSEAISLGDGNRVILKGLTVSYLLKDDEVIAEMMHFMAVNKNLHADTEGQYTVYLSPQGALLKTPLYEYDMLLEEAGRY